MGCLLHRRFSVSLSLGSSASAFWDGHATFVYGEEDCVMSPKSGSHNITEILRFPTPETAQEKPLAPRVNYMKWIYFTAMVMLLLDTRAYIFKLSKQQLSSTVLLKLHLYFRS